jgi:hypothetical protein
LGGGADDIPSRIGDPGIVERKEAALVVETDPKPASRSRPRLKYKVHRFDIRMTKGQGELEEFLNGLEGEVVAIVPNVVASLMFPRGPVDFVLVVEKLADR